MKLTHERIIAKMKRRLGGIFCEEFEDEDFIEAMESADRWFLTYLGNAKEAVLAVESGSREVSAPDDCVNVLEVVTSGRAVDFLAMVDPGAFTDGSVSNSIPSTMLRPGRGGGIGDIYQNMSHVEMISRVYGADSDWEWVRSTRKIRLYPSGVAARGGYIYVKYTSNDIDYNFMSPMEESYYLRWVEAECKKMLGRVRSKYSNLPGPGDNVEIADGQILLDEAKEEFLAIMEEIKQKPVGFIVG